MENFETCMPSFNAAISEREREILHLVSMGLSSTEIASKVYLSHHTVNDHRKNMHRKLKANNVASLIRLGYELGLLPLAS